MLASVLGPSLICVSVTQGFQGGKLLKRPEKTEWEGFLLPYAAVVK